MQHNFQLSSVYMMDNLDLMRECESETVDCTYLDPPFNSKRLYQGAGAAAPAKFKDTWSWNDAKTEWLEQLEAYRPKLFRSIWKAKDHSGGMAGYLCFMAVRLDEMHRMLKPTGTLWLHCDPSANAYLRLLLDDIFGGRHFLNEAVWSYKKMPNKARHFQKNHDTLFFYTKGDGYTFNRQYDDYSPTSLRTYERAAKIGYNANLKKKMVTVWDWNKYNQAVQDGKLPADLSPTEFKPTGSPARAVWDIPILAPSSRERTGYPTQKPEALLERIILSSTKPGDIVFDPFAGCGTALVVAQLLGRQWFGCDDDMAAEQIIRDRIARMSNQSKPGQPSMAFPVNMLHTLPPPRQVTADRSGQLRDPTGHIVPKRPSDKLTKPVVRAKLLEWQAAMDGTIQCPGCGIILPERHFDMDHLNPVSVGGANHISNRILLCGPCNGDKGNDLTIVGLWKKLGVSRADQKSRQETVRRVQSQADAYARTLDAK